MRETIRITNGNDLIKLIIVSIILKNILFGYIPSDLVMSNIIAIINPIIVEIITVKNNTSIVIPNAGKIIF